MNNYIVKFTTMNKPDYLMVVWDDEYQKLRLVNLGTGIIMDRKFSFDDEEEIEDYLRSVGEILKKNVIKPTYVS